MEKDNLFQYIIFVNEYDLILPIVFIKQFQNKFSNDLELLALSDVRLSRYLVSPFNVTKLHDLIKSLSVFKFS